MAIKFRIKRLAFYIYCIEKRHFEPNGETAGWEHFVRKSRENPPEAPEGLNSQQGRLWEQMATSVNSSGYKFGVFEVTSVALWIAIFVANTAGFVGFAIFR